MNDSLMDNPVREPRAAPSCLSEPPLLGDPHRLQV